MNPVIQQDNTGCAIASAAAIANITYEQAKQVASSLNINVNDPTLWSDTASIRTLLKQLGVKTSTKKTSFTDWPSLPNCALMAIKWHKEGNKPYWHWVVFVREKEQAYVLDSKQALKHHIRTDFGRMKPKWYIEVYP
jgi:ABC-type bacteriocin/lantibiotic exporter with double-glycine peptidase domain